jgi:hypothetical protein
MTLIFTFEEMLKSLEKIGYECRMEEEIETIDYNGHEQHKAFKVWNCYYKGNLMTELGFDRLGGTQRLERVFKYEVSKRILGLF